MTYETPAYVVPAYVVKAARTALRLRQEQASLRLMARVIAWEAAQKNKNESLTAA